MSDLKLATNAVPSVLAAAYLPTSDTTQYTAPAATTTKIASCALTNTSGGTATVTLSIVKSGGTSGASNRVLVAQSLSSGAQVTVPGFWLSPGDFVSAFSNTGSAVTLVMTGIAFSIGGGAGGATGLQVDAIGAGNRSTSSSSNSASITWTQVVGTGTNRYLISGFSVGHGSGWLDYTAYTTFSVSSSIDGALTRLSAADAGPTGQHQGTASLWGRANPTAGTHTMTASVGLSGTTFDQIVGSSISYTGVSGTSGAATASFASQTPSLAITSQSGDVPVWCFLTDIAPSDFNQRMKYFNGHPTQNTGYAKWMWLGDAAGAASVTASVSNNVNGGAIAGIDLVHA